LFIKIIEILAGWLLFTFPMYQGLMELSDYRNIFSKFDQYRGDYHEISPWYWLIPPVKIILERNRAMKVIKRFVKSDHDIKVFISFNDKATAWYFVSLGGWIDLITSIYDILEGLHLTHFILFFLLISLIATMSGFFSAYYRVSEIRQKKMVKKFKKY